MQTGNRLRGVRVSWVSDPTVGLQATSKWAGPVVAGSTVSWCRSDSQTGRGESRSSVSG